MRIKAGCKIRDIAGEKVIILMGDFGADMTRIVSLNSSGEWLFGQIEGKEFDSDELVELLIGHYNIDRETASKDAALWVEKLTEYGVIENQ